MSIKNIKTSRTFYINLDKRIDRFLSITKELNTLFKNVEKFKAIEATPSYIGCSISHVLLLESCLNDLNTDIFFIFEDDFVFEGDYEHNKLIIDTLHNPSCDFDLVMLSYHIPAMTLKFIDSPKYKGFQNIKDGQTVTGYCINHNYIPILLKNWKNALLFLNTTNNYPKYAIDQSWKILQNNDKWFACSPRLGKQMDTFSDLEQCEVSYGGTCFMAILNKKQLLNSSCFTYRYFIADPKLEVAYDDYLNMTVYLPCKDTKIDKLKEIIKWTEVKYKNLNFVFVSDDDVDFKWEKILENFSKISALGIPYKEFKNTKIEATYNPYISVQTHIVNEYQFFMSSYFIKLLTIVLNGSIPDNSLIKSSKTPIYF